MVLSIVSCCKSDGDAAIPVKISIAEEAGFCFGVKRAMKMTERVAAQGFGESEKVYTFGPLIHNPQVISRLLEKGVAVAEQMDDIHCGAGIIRNHGVPPQHFEKLKQRAARIVNATDPASPNLKAMP